MINILFVCMGNICRSPSAEGCYAAQLADSPCADQVSIDSAGTHSYHIGHSPDGRAIETAVQYDVKIAQLRARAVTAEDFQEFDLIIAMDHSNLDNLQAIQPAHSKAELKMMMAYHPSCPAGRSENGLIDEVPDPYYGGMDGFVHMFELLQLATCGLLKVVEERLK